MIERLSGSNTPIQQRTTDSDMTRVAPINVNEKKAVANPFENNQPQQDEQIKKTQVEEAVKGLNEFLQSSHTSIKFMLHEKLHEYYVAIVDDRTNDIVKEIPAKKLLDTYAAMAEHLGFLVDRKI